jgi:hypothetical protein
MEQKVPANATDTEQEKTKPSTDIPVTEFRQILIWPLAMEHPTLTADRGWLSGASRQDFAAGDIAKTGASLERLTDKSSGTHGQPRWVRLHDPLQHIAPSGGSERAQGVDKDAYAEFVYFHPYVQQFLYQKQKRGVFDKLSGDDSVPFYLFHYENIKHAEVDVPISGGEVKRFYANIDRLNLYLFSSGVALLALEVVVNGTAVFSADTAQDTDLPSSFDNPSLSLHDVLFFQERFRRCYVPFWFDNFTQGKVCSAVTWFDENGKAIISSSYGSDDGANEFARLGQGSHDKGRRFAPVFKHWRDLLPLKLRGYEEGDKAGPAWWRHVVDERMPSMAYVAMPENSLDSIQRDDFIRLCFADEPGSATYYEKFTRSFEGKNCYDRFLHLGTRHMFSGYSYAVVCSDPGFQGLLVNHFRRHYFQIALLNHFESATLLTHSSWISDAVEKYKGRLRTRAFEESIMLIQEELLSFAHRFRFTALSNQLQACEMQEYWRTQLKLDELYEGVKDELKTATDYLFAKDQTEQTLSGNRLAIVAVLVAVLALPMAFLGMNFVAEDGFFGFQITSSWSQLRVYLGLTFITSVLGLILTWFTATGREKMPTEKRLFRVLGIIAAASAVAWYFSF